MYNSQWYALMRLTNYMRAWRPMVNRRRAHALNKLYACVAELVDALASGASVPRDVEVQVLSRVPKKKEIE